MPTKSKKRAFLEELELAAALEVLESDWTGESWERSISNCLCMVISCSSRRFFSTSVFCFDIVEKAAAIGICFLRLGCAGEASEELAPRRLSLIVAGV